MFLLACSFAFGELKLMEGSAKIISFIARDENQHLAITQNILNKWKQVMILKWFRSLRKKRNGSSNV